MRRRRRRIKTGFRRALVSLFVLALALFALNVGWDYIKGNPRFFFLRDRNWLLANLALVALLPPCAFLSAFPKHAKPQKEKTNEQ